MNKLIQSNLIVLKFPQSVYATIHLKVLLTRRRDCFFNDNWLAFVVARRTSTFFQEILGKS